MLYKLIIFGLRRTKICRFHLRLRNIYNQVVHLNEITFLNLGSIVVFIFFPFILEKCQV
jgi:hypothetical protein